MCGILGTQVLATKLAASQVVMGEFLHLANRGPHSVGFAVQDSGGAQPSRLWKEAGSPAELLGNREFAKGLVKEYPGNQAIGHVRYATASKRDKRNAQPLYCDNSGRKLLVASNGDLPFCSDLRNELKKLRYEFASECDGEVIAKLLGHQIFRRDLSEVDAFKLVGSTLQGAFSLVALTPERKFIAMRDPSGVRPISWTRNRKLVFVCSESALVANYGTPVELEPGTMLVVYPDGTQEIHEFAKKPQRFCLMEVFYFSRPDSKFNDLSYAYWRRELGRVLAQEWLSQELPRPEVVTAVQFSGTHAGEGFAEELGVPFRSVIGKDRNSGRLFLASTESRREKTKRTFGIERETLPQGGLVIVDDSIVRGDQSAALLQLIKPKGQQQPAWLGYASTAPQITDPCFLGINTPDPSRLVGRGRTVEEIRQKIGADHLLYLPLERVMQVMKTENFCTGCFGGEYPYLVPDGHAEV